MYAQSHPSYDCWRVSSSHKGRQLPAMDWKLLGSWLMRAGLGLLASLDFGFLENWYGREPRNLEKTTRALHVWQRQRIYIPLWYAAAAAESAKCPRLSGKHQRNSTATVQQPTPYLPKAMLKKCFIISLASTSILPSIAHPNNKPRN